MRSRLVAAFVGLFALTALGACQSGPTAAALQAETAKLPWDRATQRDTATLGAAREVGGVARGVAGTPSEPIAALRRLVQGPHARESLLWVLAHGRVEGQLMSLAGLYSVDPASFQSALPAYATLDEEVVVAGEGCSPSPRKVQIRTLVRHDHPRAVRLSGPTDSYDRYVSGIQGGLPVDDLFGGGLPARWLGGGGALPPAPEARVDDALRRPAPIAVPSPELQSVAPVAPPPSPPLLPAPVEPGGTVRRFQVFRTCGGNVDNAQLKTKYRSIGISNTYYDAGLGMSLGYASFGFSKTPDNRLCSARVNIRSYLYTDLDGDGRFDARDHGEHRQIALVDRWVDVGRSMGGSANWTQEAKDQAIYRFDAGAWRAGTPQLLMGPRGAPAGRCRAAADVPVPVGPEWQRSSPSNATAECSKEVDMRVEQVGEATRFTVPLQGERVVVEDAPRRVTLRTRFGTWRVDLAGDEVTRVEVELGGFRYVDTNGDGVFEEASSARGGRPIPPG